MASMQTKPVLATAATTPSYANLLYCQGSQRIRNHDLGASSQEIYARTRRIRELEKGDPETIGKYCDEVINAGANIELILDAMSALRANIGASDYPAYNRQLIRDSLERVYSSNVRLDNAAYNQLYQAINAIGRAE